MEFVPHYKRLVEFMCACMVYFIQANQGILPNHQYNELTDAGVSIKPAFCRPLWLYVHH